MSSRGATRTFSMRMARSTLSRLERRGHELGEPKTRLAQRLIEEGLRMEAHPGVVFRDGPAGRRPGLAAGPDVSEVIRTIKNTGRKGDKAVAAAAAWLDLSPGQVETAVRYYADHRGEVDEWLRRADELADRELAAWQRRQDALA